MDVQRCVRFCAMDRVNLTTANANRTEFSHEVILCFIEYNQLKKLLIRTENLDADCEGYKFHSAMPKSTIVHSNAPDPNAGRLPQEMPELPARSPSSAESTTATTTTRLTIDEHMQRVAHQLYVKYGGTGATFEVNISSKLRHSLDELEQNEWGVDGLVLIAAVDELIDSMMY